MIISEFNHQSTIFIELSAKETPRIGLANGTFDIIHDGHVSLWKEALSQLHLDAVFIWHDVYAKHKPHAQVYETRLKLLAQKLKNEPYIHCLPNIRPLTKEPKFGAATLDNEQAQHIRVRQTLKQYLPSNATFFQVFGSDNLNKVLLTKAIVDIILEDAQIVVLERSNHPLVRKLPKETISLNRTVDSIYFKGLSSSLIREVNEKYGTSHLRMVNTIFLERDRLSQIEEKIVFDEETKEICFLISKNKQLIMLNPSASSKYLSSNQKDIYISEVPHWYIDLRVSSPIVINRPETFPQSQLLTVVNLATKIQDLSIQYGFTSLSSLQVFNKEIF
ncbi:MAG: adenylyltransferase/cytidyltransferase family protein [Anaerolineae bacterium]|nr:adenylyltransferase/cytidyltransferase family protein [Anaerolineae bacterium]